MTPEMLDRILRPIKNKLYNIIGRAILTALDNSGKTLKAQVQVFGTETFDGIDVLQNYGFESLADAADNDNEVLLSSIGGNRVMSTATAVHNREHRPKDLAAGESKVYTKFGQYIHLKADGSVKVYAPGKSVDVECGTLNVAAATRINLGSGAAGKVVTTESTCAFTGGPHPDGCAKVFALK